MNEAWERLKALAQKRQEKLYGAHEIQHFNRDADETITWIEEKNILLSPDDFGKDLASVQTLQRKHDGLERDLAALDDKVIVLAWSCFGLRLHISIYSCVYLDGMNI